METRYDIALSASCDSMYTCVCLCVHVSVYVSVCVVCII